MTDPREGCAVRYIDIPSGSGELWSHDGEPLWPVAGPGQLLALQTIVGAMGGTSLPSTGSQGSLVGGDEVVAALGEAVAGEARLYAHLTRRDAVVVSGADDLASIDRLAVLVAFEEDLDFDLLAALYDAERDSAPGIVYAPTMERLRAQVLVRSAVARLRCPLSLRRVDVFPKLEIGTIEVAEDWRLLGRDATAAAMRSAVGSNAGLLHLETVSDGLDAFLRPDLVLCGVHDAAPTAPARMRPLCKLTNYCHRTHEPVDVAAAGGKLLAPEEIAARVFVLDACWGWRPSPRVSSADWGFTERLLRSFRIGALLVPWEVTMTAPYVSAELLDALAAGETLGAALAAHIGRWRDVNGHRLCLVGDPAVCLPEPVKPPPSPLVPSGRPSNGEQSATIARSLAFLRAYATAARRGPLLAYEDLADEVLNVLAECEQAVLELRPLEEGDDPVGPRLRRTLLRFLAGQWTLVASKWAPWIEETTAVSARPCWVCGVGARQFDFRLWTAGRPERTVVVCPSCGYVADLPKGRRLQLGWMPDGTLRMHGDTKAASATVAVHSPRLQNAQVMSELSSAWPEVDGKLATEFKPTANWPEGPIRLAVVVVWNDFEVGVLGSQDRGEHFNAHGSS